MSDFQLLGAFFHEHVLRKEGLIEAPPQLTERESEVLKWAAVGKTDQDIADILGIGAATVRMYMSYVRIKLKVTTRIQAVARAIRLGMI